MTSADRRVPQPESAKLAIAGGQPVRTRPWPTYEKGDVFISPQDEAAALSAIQGRRYFRYDDRPLEQTWTGRLENRLCEMFGSRYALACTSGTTATHIDARRLAPFARQMHKRGISLHVSGCAKGCAHPRAAAITLVGTDNGFDLIRHGSAQDAPVFRGLEQAKILANPAALLGVG